jgi:spermidine synthase
MGVASTGGTAGNVSALSTLGSILGTLIPSFYLIPYLGTSATLYLAAVIILAFSIIGLLNVRAQRQAAVTGALLAVVLALAIFAPRGFVKPAALEGSTLLYEKESAYNYIQVVKDQAGWVDLILNEGHAIHSKYHPQQVLTGGPWDYWSVAPYFTEGFEPSDMKSMAMIGSAAGTAGRVFNAIYGPLPVDGVEIDPEIVEVGRRYFALDELKSYTTYEQDGRTFLQTEGRDKKYTVIGIDAYRQPYIPFHLTTVEFFQEVRDHLTPGGAVMINAGRTDTDTRLVDALANTMLQVYPHVYVIDVPSLFNSMVVGTNGPARLENFAQNAAGVQNSTLKQVFEASLERGNIREVKPQPDGIVFTDDRAPVEAVIDQIILGAVDQATE